MPPALNTSNGGGATLQSNASVSAARGDMNTVATIDAPQEAAMWAGTISATAYDNGGVICLILPIGWSMVAVTSSPPFLQMNLGRSPRALTPSPRGRGTPRGTSNASSISVTK